MSYRMSCGDTRCVTNLLKNFFIFLLNPKQQATNDKRGAVRCAVNEIKAPLPLNEIVSFRKMFSVLSIKTLDRFWIDGRSVRE